MIFERYITSPTLSFFRAKSSMFLIRDSFITCIYSAMHIICGIPFFLEIKTMDNKAAHYSSHHCNLKWGVAWIQSKINKRHLRTKLVKVANPDNSVKIHLQVLLLMAINKISRQCDRYYGAWFGLLSVFDIYVFWLNLSCPKPTVITCNQV